MPPVAAGRTTRMDILELLRRRQGASAESISGELGITPNAVRQHLSNLERAGLVSSSPQRHKRGRPALQFTLTDEADSVFPKRYGQLASMVLTEVRGAQGEAALDDLFQRIAIRQVRRMSAHLGALGFEEKLEKVLQWIGRAGTLPLLERGPEGWVVSIQNCPFRDTALRFPQVCSLTPRILTELLQAPVSQSRSIHRRDPYCAFVIQSPADAERG